MIKANRVCLVSILSERSEGLHESMVPYAFLMLATQKTKAGKAQRLHNLNSPLQKGNRKAKDQQVVLKMGDIKTDNGRAYFQINQ